MRKQDGTEYKPDALMGMVTSALRAYSTTAKEKALSLNQEPPTKTRPEGFTPAAQQPDCRDEAAPPAGPALRTPRRAEPSRAPTGPHIPLCRLVGIARLICWFINMPESSYKHTMRGLIILASNRGGRECEYHAIIRGWIWHCVTCQARTSSLTCASTVLVLQHFMACAGQVAQQSCSVCHVFCCSAALVLCPCGIKPVSHQLGNGMVVFWRCVQHIATECLT
jgi:hypothetical protein